MLQRYLQAPSRGNGLYSGLTHCVPSEPFGRGEGEAR